MEKRVAALILALVMAVGLGCSAGAAGETVSPAASSNAGQQDYAAWTKPTTSFLFDDGTGFTRVEYIPDNLNYNAFAGISGRVVVECYTDDFRLKEQISLEMELPKWGGFFAGTNYNYCFFGKDNFEEDDTAESIRIVQYSKDWERLGQISVRGNNIAGPFDYGNLRCAEYGDMVYVRAGHRMYKSSDGNNHQASLTICFQQEERIATTVQSYGGIGYVSHSLNQFILIDQQGNIITLDQGDAYPRSLEMMRWKIKAGKTPERNMYGRDVTSFSAFELPETKVYQYTGSSVGGMVETSKGYLVAYNYDTTGEAARDRHIFLGFTPKGFREDTEVTRRCVTSTQVRTTTPHLAATSLEGGYILWENMSAQYPYTYTLCYATYDADGTVGEVQSVPGGRLSDCKPVQYADGVVWYVTENGAPTFYFLNEDGVRTYATADLLSPCADWATEEVNGALKAGLVSRALQNQNPTQDITRGEFCQLMMTLLEKETGKGVDCYLKENGKTNLNNPFSDTTDHVTLAAYALGIVKGTGDGSTFSPKQNITRQEAAVMLSRMAALLKVSGGTESEFADRDSIAFWALEEVEAVAGLKDATNGKAVMGGTGGGNFSPEMTYSREQAYLTALRLLNCAGEKALPNHEHISGSMPALAEVVDDETDWDLDDEWDDTSDGEDDTDDEVGYIDITTGGNAGATGNTTVSAAQAFGFPTPKKEPDYENPTDYLYFCNTHPQALSYATLEIVDGRTIRMMGRSKIDWRLDYNYALVGICTGKEKVSPDPELIAVGARENYDDIYKVELTLDDRQMEIVRENCEKYGKMSLVLYDRLHLTEDNKFQAGGHVTGESCYVTLDENGELKLWVDLRSVSATDHLREIGIELAPTLNSEDYVFTDVTDRYDPTH